MKPEDITLDWLYARVVERDGCLIWVKGVSSPGGDPITRIGDNMRPVRLLLWELIHDGKMPKTMRSWCKCNNRLCVHPEHVVARSWNAALKGRTRPLHERAAVAAGMRKTSDLTPETINKIRDSAASKYVLGEQFGIDPDYANQIRRHEVWRDYTNPFSSLAA